VGERLALLGDLAPELAGTQADTYSAELAQAVKRFQDRHGLDADGKLGRQTLAALNVPLAVRVRQIELSLERLRWLPDLSGGPFIAVNLPSFRLWAFRRSPNISQWPRPAATLSAFIGLFQPTIRAEVHPGRRKHNADQHDDHIQFRGGFQFDKVFSATRHDNFALVEASRHSVQVPFKRRVRRHVLLQPQGLSLEHRAKSARSAQSFLPSFVSRFARRSPYKQLLVERNAKIADRPGLWFARQSNSGCIQKLRLQKLKDLA
jgi:hypothetical protein